MADDVAVLREILQRELETINTYEDMIARLKDPALRQIVEHITDEEREHVAEMYQLIVERDPRQQALSERSRQHVEGLSAPPGPGVVAQAPAPPVSSVGALDLIPPPPPVFPTGAWSVGPLKQRK